MERWPNSMPGKMANPSLYGGAGYKCRAVPTQRVRGGRVFQSGGDAEEGRAPSLMLLFAEHEARQ
jgi:hypothetical protein